MPDRIPLRELTAEERAELERIARARTAPAHLAERATILLGAADGRAVGRIAHEAGVSRPTVSAWVRRFNDGGLAALRDRPRSGRPPTYGADQRDAVVAGALTDPKELGLPFASWGLDRLQAYLDEMGLQSARSYPGQQQPVLAEPRPGDDGAARPAERARQEVDYGCRGKGSIFGAFRPATGEALTAPMRVAASPIGSTSWRGPRRGSRPTSAGSTPSSTT